jgi:hypothetical protein
MQVREVSKTRVAYKAPAQRPVNSQARLLTLSVHVTIISVTPEDADAYCKYVRSLSIFQQAIDKAPRASRASGRPFGNLLYKLS